MPNFQTKIKSFTDTYKPFRNIIWFLILFIGIDFIWKLFVDENGESIIVLGKDLSDTVKPICFWTANISYWVVKNIFGYDSIVINGDLIYFEGSKWFRIVWECTGVKQMIMFAVLIILYFGPVKKKLWFIPLSMLILYAINIVRILGILFITKDGFPDWFIPFNEWYNGRQWENTNVTYWEFYNDWFEFYHKDVFSWLYCNGLLFLLWLWWEEAFNLPYQKVKDKLKKKELPASDSPS